jgi:predicted AlkP superfamily pyrophosphatase or phosphodiesterase
VATSSAAKVLVVGIDGVRWDALHRARTPALDAITARGFRAPVQVHTAGPTISGPCWATIATGTLASTHGVLDNENPPDAMPADFLTAARGAGLRTFAAASWPAMLSPVECGPIFAPDARMTVAADPGHRLDAWDTADQLVADEACEALADGEIDVAFVYLGVADEVAHALGVGPEYLAAIEACDRRLGAVIDGIGALNGQGEWNVIAVTDHGHVDAGGHGGDSPEERTAWITACGPRMPRESPARLEQADVYAQALSVFGLPVEPDRYARPFGTR